ncbi:MAG: hypothetical protein ACOCQX_04305 [Candidatus Nanoarchaeia archaeon]
MGIETLPSSLGKALEYLKNDRVVKEALGKHTSPVYLNAKRKE